MLSVLFIIMRVGGRVRLFNHLVAVQFLVRNYHSLSLSFNYMHSVIHFSGLLKIRHYLVSASDSKFDRFDSSFGDKTMAYIPSKCKNNLLLYIKIVDM